MRLHKGFLNPNYRHGKFVFPKYCIDCHKIVKDVRSRRCVKCFIKYKKYNAKKYSCKDCGIKISHQSQRCNLCSYKLLEGKHNPMHKIRGPNHPNWKGGISKQSYPIQFNPRLKRFIRKRDNFICQLCGIPEKKSIKILKRKLPIHHIDYNKENCDQGNLITLCSACNSKVNFHREKWLKIFKSKIKRGSLCEKEVVVNG